MRKKKSYNVSNKNEIYKFIQSLYTILKKQSKLIKFKKLSGACAYYYGHNGKLDEIDIDPRKQIIPSLIHEVLHHLHEDWCETAVEVNERKIINALTPRQIKNIIRIWGKNMR